MNPNFQDILDICASEFPDSAEFVGEVWLQLPEIWAAMRQQRAGEPRFQECMRRLRRIRSGARNEGRLHGEILSGTMHEFDSNDVPPDQDGA